MYARLSHVETGRRSWLQLSELGVLNSTWFSNPFPLILKGPSPPNRGASYRLSEQTSRPSSLLAQS